MGVALPSGMILNEGDHICLNSGPVVAGPAELASMHLGCSLHGGEYKSLISLVFGAEYILVSLLQSSRLKVRLEVTGSS